MVGKGRQWLYMYLVLHILFFCLFLLHLLPQSWLILPLLCPRKGTSLAEVRDLMSTGRHTDHDKKSAKRGQETPILWPPDAKNRLIGKKPWCWERLKVGGEGEDRGWDGWMASLTRGTWVWVSSGSWWWTGRPGVLQSMGSQRVGHDWGTELNWSYRKLEYSPHVWVLEGSRQLKEDKEDEAANGKLKYNNEEFSVVQWLGPRASTAEGPV